jgi:DNA-directed RNA polymerase subunit RPC12/RpoP
MTFDVLTYYRVINMSHRPKSLLKKLKDLEAEVKGLRRTNSFLRKDQGDLIDENIKLRGLVVNSEVVRIRCSICGKEGEAKIPETFDRDDEIKKIRCPDCHQFDFVPVPSP